MRAAGLSDQDVAEALAVVRLRVVEEFQAVHIFEIKVQRAFGAVDFDGDVVLAAQREASGFKIRERAVLEAANADRGIVDSDFAHFLRRLAAEAITFAVSSITGRSLMKVFIRPHTSLNSPTR